MLCQKNVRGITILLIKWNMKMKKYLEPNSREILHTYHHLVYNNYLGPLRSSTRTVPETQLYEGPQLNLLTPNSVTNPTNTTNTNSLHVCTQTPISETKISEQKPRKRRKQRTCVYCRTNNGKYKWTSYYCPVCNVALCKGSCFSQYHTSICTSIWNITTDTYDYDTYDYDYKNWLVLWAINGLTTRSNVQSLCLSENLRTCLQLILII